MRAISSCVNEPPSPLLWSPPQRPRGFEDGSIHKARLALGGVAAKPWRAQERLKYRLQALAAGSESSFAKAAEMALAGRAIGDNAFKIELARRIRTARADPRPRRDARARCRLCRLHRSRAVPGVPCRMRAAILPYRTAYRRTAPSRPAADAPGRPAQGHRPCDLRRRQSSRWNALCRDGGRQHRTRKVEALDVVSAKVASGRRGGPHPCQWATAGPRSEREDGAVRLPGGSLAGRNSGAVRQSADRAGDRLKRSKRRRRARLLLRPQYETEEVTGRPWRAALPYELTGVGVGSPARTVFGDIEAGFAAARTSPSLITLRRRNIITRWNPTPSSPNGTATG